jgi:DNA-binding NtrC family response regulator
MIRIGLYTEDHTLRPLLASALGSEFSVIAKAENEEIGDYDLPADCDVALLDLNERVDELPRRIAFARSLILADLPTVILTDDALRSTAFELVRRGAFGCCRRPPSMRELRTLLTRAFESNAKKHDEQDAQPTPEQPGNCDKIIGSSQRMQCVYRLVRSVTSIRAAVLITGESGTGKELIARAIHNLGSRSSCPFVAVSCGAIPETLIEAELFGHEKGAFTGTVGAREGYFEQAADGTLFLDEIGDLSLYTQVKLLRVLQQMEFSRLGSNRLIPLRARLIFATHRDLGQLVAEGKFRQDLFYRINVMRIDAPPLRERSEDIPALAQHLLRHYGIVFQKPLRGFDPEAMELMQSYSWPGNVRELENLIQRALILAEGPTIGCDDLSIAPQDEELSPLDDVVDIGDYHPAGSFERLLRDYKIKLAVGAVRDHGGNKTLAARSLCISRAYLHRLLKLAGSEALVEQSSASQGIA